MFLPFSSSIYLSRLPHCQLSLFTLTALHELPPLPCRCKQQGGARRRQQPAQRSLPPAAGEDATTARSLRPRRRIQKSARAPPSATIPGHRLINKLDCLHLKDRLNTKNADTGLQPVSETRERQVKLWKELIVDFCRTQKYFVIGTEEDFPLFKNPVIERSLTHEAKEVFIAALVYEGLAEWIDKGHRKCLVLWRSIPDWANVIVNFVKENGLEDGVTTIEDLRSGIESRGSELEGIDRVVLLRALRLLEQKGKVAIFKGSAADDEGVKFSL